jgi:hypothetical protein
MFNGEDHILVENHMETFECFTDNFEIIHEDVFMRTLCKYLYGDVGFWFRNLKVDSISSWNDLRNVFLRYWGEKKSFEQYLSEFYALRREHDEVVIVFNRRFHNFYLNMPMEIQPTEVTAMVQYTIAQHPDLVLFLRERRSSSLQHMFTDAEEIEDNIRACGRLLNQVLDKDLEHEQVYEQHEIIFGYRGIQGRIWTLEI